MRPDDAIADNDARTSFEHVAHEDEEVARVLDAYLADLESGSFIDPEMLLAQHPSIAPRLRSCLAGLQLLDAGTSQTKSTPILLGEYTIVREIGRGGMGVVYEAIHQTQNTRVALKVLPFAASLDPRQLQRFKNEAHAASQLRHPHIVPVHEVGCVGGTHYYTMQLIVGQSLSALWHQKRHEAREMKHAVVAEDATETKSIAGQISRDATTSVADLRWNTTAYVRAVVSLIRKAAEALDHAHHVGVIHRDVKPSNLLVDRGGRLWITDFGLASVQGHEGLTATGDLLGTLRYMSPEQALARRGVVDHRTDIYSLGVTLYELLTLRPAVEGRDREDLLSQLSSTEPRLPGRLNPAVSRDLETIVLTAIAKSPSERYQTASALADDLGRLLAGRPIHARRPGLSVRARKWLARHRSWAIAIGLMLFAATIGLSISTALVWRALLAEEFQRRLAAAKQVESRRHLYAAEMNLALDAWDRGNVARVWDLLERQRPATGQEDLRGFEWYHLCRRCRAASQAELPAHSGPIRSLATTADGAMWATSGDDFAIRLWSSATLELLHTFELVKEKPAGVAISPDGKWLAAAIPLGVRVWNLNSFELVSYLRNHSGYEYAVAFSPDSRLLVASSGIVWEAATGKELPRLTVRGQIANSVAVSPDNSFMVGGGNDGQVLVWDLRSPALPPAELGKHRTYIHSVAFSPDGQTLITGSEDGVVHLWDFPRRQQIRSLRRHTGAVSGALFCPDNQNIATVSWDGSIKLWNFDTDAVTLQQGHAGQIYAVAITADGQRLLSGGDDGRLRIWNLSAQWEPLILSANKSLIRGLGFSADCQSLVSGAADGSVMRWDLRGQQQPLAYENGSREAPGWYKALPQPVPGVKPYAVMSASFMSDQSLLLADLGGRVWLLDREMHASPLEFDEVAGPLWSLAVSPDKKTLAAAGYRSNTVVVWDAKTGKIRGRLSGHTDRVWSVAFSSDNRMMASGANDRTVRIWDAATGVLLRTIDLGCEWIYTLTFSPDSQSVVASGGDNRIRCFDVASGKEHEPVGQHPATIRALAYFPDGKTLASGSDDGTVTLWDVTTRCQRFTLQTPHSSAAPIQSGSSAPLVNSPANSIWSIAIAPDGQAVAAGDSQGQITVWRARSIH